MCKNAHAGLEAADAPRATAEDIDQFSVGHLALPDLIFLFVVARHRRDLFSDYSPAGGTITALIARDVGKSRWQLYCEIKPIRWARGGYDVAPWHKADIVRCPTVPSENYIRA
jgi:hypothetical protein